MGFIEIAAAENARIGVAEQLFAEQTSNHIVDRIAQHRRDRQQRHHHMHIKIVGRQRGQRASDEQQRIARQKRRDHRARFAKQDQKQNGVDPDAILRHQLGEMNIDMQDKIDNKTD